MLRYDSGKVSPWMALRNAAGVALPLVAGVATGTLSGGLIVSTGALNVAFSDSDAPYAQRARRMLRASALVGIAVFAGALCGHSAVIAVATAAMWAFAAGMLVALGSTAADLGAMSLVVLVVYSAFPMPLDKALVSGLLALAGGLFQTLLAVAFWPLRRFAPERRALGELYRALAHAAASPVPASEAPPATAESTQAQDALATLDRDHSIEAEHYRLLLSQAERMRLSLLTLARLRKRIEREEPANPGSRDSGPLFLSALTGAQLPGQFAGGRGALFDPLRRNCRNFRGWRSSCAHSRRRRPSLATAMVADGRFQVDAIAGQLRSAADLAAYSTPLASRRSSGTKRDSRGVYGSEASRPRCGPT